MRKSIKFTVSLVLTVFSLLTFVFIASNGEYTDLEVERAIEKAELLSQDFSKIISLEWVEKANSFYDAINKEEVKSVVIRITSKYVLEARYAESNKIISSEIISESDIVRTFFVFITLLACFCFLIATFEYGMELRSEYKNRKRDKKEDENNTKRDRTASKKRGFLKHKR